MSSLTELEHIYSNNRTCRVCHQSHRVASDAAAYNFDGRYWLCRSCNPVAPDARRELARALEAERLQLIALVS